jgi:hypothetical protein
VRSALVTALVARAENSLKARVRRFLRGLSCDELQFIASFLGACILESTAAPLAKCPCVEGAGLPPSPGITDRYAEDWDLKMILLKEYLCRCGMQTSIPVSTEASFGSSG